MGEYRPSSGHRYFTILAIAFSPGLIGSYGLLLPILLCAGSTRSISLRPSLAEAIPDLAVIAGLALLPALVVVCAMPLVSAARTWQRRAAVVYATWLILGLAMAMVLAISLAGASMAVVEGVTSGWDLKLQEFQFALSLLPPMQAVILPWVALATVFLGRLYPVGARSQPNEENPRG